MISLLIGCLDEPAVKPRNPKSQCIQIANLKMPYSILDMHDLVEEYGRFEICHLNRSQTHCLVKVRLNNLLFCENNMSEISTKPPFEML